MATAKQPFGIEGVITAYLSCLGFGHFCAIIRFLFCIDTCIILAVSLFALLRYRGYRISFTPSIRLFFGILQSVPLVVLDGEASLHDLEPFANSTTYPIVSMNCKESLSSSKLLPRSQQ